MLGAVIMIALFPGIWGKWHVIFIHLITYVFMICFGSLVYYLCFYDLFLPINQGILSTESGQRALTSFDSYERSLIEASILLFIMSTF